MPVVVIGGSGPVGRALIPRLVAAGSEVRAVVLPRNGIVDELRAYGAKVAIGDPRNPDFLPAVFRDAHTLCHLVDTFPVEDDAYFPRIAATVQAAVDAAREAELARTVLLSYPGADTSSPNAFLRALGTAEEAVRSSSLGHVIVRSTHVCGHDSLWLRNMISPLRGPVATVLGAGTQRVAPVFAEDVAAVLAAADDRSEEVQGLFGLQGPDVVTADELADFVAGRRRLKVHVSPRWVTRITPLRGRRFSPAALEILSSDSLTDGPDAAAEFGVKLTPLRQALQVSGFIPT